MNNYLRNLIYFIFYILIFFSASQAQALIINGYDPDIFDRFLPGTYSADPISNPNFFAADYDWSGVGWQTNAISRSVALISPQRFVAANHYKVPIGETVTFYNQSGQLKNYTVESYSSFSSVDSGTTHISDLVVGRLSEAISEADGISHYKVLDADDYTTNWYDTDWYTDKEIYTYGTMARAGNNTIGYFANTTTMPIGSNPDNSTLCAVYDTHATGDYYGEAGGQGGDSGSPSFIPYNGELTLMGTHFAINGNTSSTWRTYDSFIPNYLDAIDAAVGADGYQVNRIVVDVFPYKLKNKNFEQWDNNDCKPADWQIQNKVEGPMLTRMVQSSEHVKSGEKSVLFGERIFSRQGVRNHSTYSYQSIEGAKPGQEYSFSFWYLNTVEIAKEMLIDSAELKIMAGIDPTGGIDSNSANIIWEVFLLNPDEFDADWHQMMVSAVAGNSAMTFFIDRELFANVTAADVAAGKYWLANTYFDDSEIHSVPEPSSFILLSSSLFGLFVLRMNKKHR